MEFEFVDTERLKLRKVTPEVYLYVFKNYSSEQLKMFWGVKDDDEIEKLGSRIDKGLTTFNKSFLYFYLIDKTNDKVIGVCGFHTWYIDHNRAEIFYHLINEEDKRKGLMSEAIPAIIDYGFNQMKLHRIEAFIGTNNLASLSLVKKYAFIQEGHLREHYCKEGKMEDSLVFSLLKHGYFKQ
ncbi:MAG: GNAT family protein [Bacteroidetes bacterium]|nr:GNAT family protein [Bacteroidota bacterium]